MAACDRPGERKFSQYFQELDDAAKKRYVQKINSISEKLDDPYTFSAPHLITPQTLPDIQYPDIYNYLIESPSVYTKDDLKAYKSLDAYKYLLTGWVGEVSVHCIENSNRVVVVHAKVRHSQAVKAKLQLHWVAAKKDGTVVASHCTCMAGLWEACSHNYCCCVVCCGNIQQTL